MADAPPPLATEPSDVDVPLIVRVGLALAAIVLACACALLGLRAWLARDTMQPAGPSVQAPALERFAVPRLESQPGAGLAQLEQDKAQKLHRYRWVDRAQGVVQIPIERAIELLAHEHDERRDDEPAR
jgi:hypothetical protein